MIGCYGALALSACLSGAGDPSVAFEPPGPRARLLAIGITSDLAPPLRRALTPDPEFFAPVPAPRPGDWLASHEERGQTFEQFRTARRNIPTRRRAAIYLLPVGRFDASRSPPLDGLQECAEAFFGLRVKTLPRVSLDGLELTERLHPATGRRQLLTGDLLRMLRGRLPRDAFCLLGVTMEDLYPGPDWNFVFGQALIPARVGVYSFARYDPAAGGERASAARRRVLLRRSCRVLCHETGHLFSMQHCIHFRCLMNGSNHLDESDSMPLRLCPVCLRKLFSATGGDPALRYRRLLRFHRRVRFREEARWIERRLKKIESKR